jgi:predicted O-methyltransferase YrrM
MALLSARLRRLVPDRLRDDRHLRALAVGLGVIPPRRMHSDEDMAVLLGAAVQARRVVEIGVYEGASALTLCAAMAPGAELHLIDPFGAHADALPADWGASEWATRRGGARALRRRGSERPRVWWHVALSHEVAARWPGPVDLVFIDGDHSEAGCALDWSLWAPLVAPGGHVVFHDARADRPGGRGLPGPTAVVTGIRAAGEPEWEIVAEADRTVALRRVPTG